MRRRIKKNNKKEEKSEEIKELAYDLDSVKDAIEVCIDFEKATGTELISKKGRLEFSKMYSKKEKESRVKELVVETVREEVQKQISPINTKLDQLIQQSAPKPNTTKPPTDIDIEEIRRKYLSDDKEI